MGRLLIPERMVTVQCEACEIIEQNEIAEQPLSIPPEEPPVSPPQNDFRTIATAALNRGFKYLTPLRPDKKTPILRGYTKRAPTTQAQIEEWDKKFHGFGVGIVCRRGIGTTMAFDDDSGVAEQIERETGKTIPKTYTVSSRLETAPWKRHFYFTQTKYSNERLPKTINAKDVGGRYDVKIKGQVVAAGTIHSKTGKPYAIATDFPDFPIGVPIPEWLVNWFVMDKERCRQARISAKLAKSKGEPIEPSQIRTPEQIERLTERAEQLKLVKQERVGRQLLSSTDLVPVGERHSVWWQKACAWAATMPRRAIFTGLLAYSEDHFYDGVNFAHENYQDAHNDAYSPKLQFGNTWIGENKEKESKVIVEAPSRHRLLVDAALQFPDGITKDERYEKFARALEGTDWAPINKKDPTDREAIKKVREEAGFESKGGGRYTKWYKRRNIGENVGDVMVTSARAQVTLATGLKERITEQRIIGHGDVTLNSTVESEVC